MNHHHCPLQLTSAASSRQLAPNVLKMIGHFNRMSRWVCECIVKETSLKDRARALRLCVGLARASFELRVCRAAALVATFLSEPVPPLRVT